MIVKIMIVDDSELIITVLTRVINDFNPGIDLHFIRAHNGSQAVDKYKEEKPDLVFMDIKMPEMDGLTALKNIKKFDDRAKVVIVTSLVQEEYIKYAVEVGAVEFISKPFKNEDIKSVLERFLQIDWVIR
jgi:two-component system, chemotaxis family, chemotaxis protein CheY